MIKLFTFLPVLVSVITADVISPARIRGATLVLLCIDTTAPLYPNLPYQTPYLTDTFALYDIPFERYHEFKNKPISACCDIPELGDAKPLKECSNNKLSGPCNEVQCVFEKSGFLVDSTTLNKEAYKNHLRKWGESNKGWTAAIEKAIQDCVDVDLRQYLDVPCKAYDVFTCTGIAMLKKCPDYAWKC